MIVFDSCDLLSGWHGSVVGELVGKDVLVGGIQLRDGLGVSPVV